MPTTWKTTAIWTTPCALSPKQLKYGKMRALHPINTTPFIVELAGAAAKHSSTHGSWVGPAYRYTTAAGSSGATTPPTQLKPATPKISTPTKNHAEFAVDFSLV